MFRKDLIAVAQDLLDRLSIIRLRRRALMREVRPLYVKEEGYLYAAFGDQYVAEALESAKSLKTKTSKPICLISDSDLQDPVFDEFIRVPFGHSRSKVDYIFDSPYRKTIYMDSDTCTLESVDHLFQLLDKFDVIAAHDYTRKRERWSKIWPEYSEIPEGFSEVNAGILGFNKETTQTLFQDWKKLYYGMAGRIKWDQPSFRVSLWRFEGKVYILPPEYNLRSAATREKARDQNSSENSKWVFRPRVLHWRGAKESNLEQAAPH